MGGAGYSKLNSVRYLETKPFLYRTRMSKNTTAPRSEPLPPAKRSRREKFCPHCEKHVSKSTYYDHAALYFDKGSKTWTRECLSLNTDLQCTSSASFKPAIDEHSTILASEFVPSMQQPSSAMDPELDQVGIHYITECHHTLL